MFAKWREKFFRRRRAQPPHVNAEVDRAAVQREQRMFTACLLVIIVGIVLLMVVT